MSHPLNVTTIALIGFGELGQRFARDFLERAGLAVAAYDIVFDDPATGAARRAAAQAAGVTAATTPATACAGADIVISAVTADQAEAVAATTAPLLANGQVYLDVNSAAPATKQRAAALVEAHGAHYVEGAVMGAIKGPGIKVEILAGGPQAARAAEALNALGMNITAVAVAFGKASATKLCRSIMIKGMEALMVDSARACRHWDVEEPVYTSLARTFPGTDWVQIAANMEERVATHGVRRSAEMREAADMLRDMGLDPSLSAAVAAAQLRGAKKKAGAP